MEEQVKNWMVAYVAEVWNGNQADVNVHDTFDALNLDSVEAIIMAGLMEEEYDIEIDPRELYDNPSIALFSKHLGARLTAKGDASA